MAVVGFAEEQPRIPIRLLKLEGLLTEAGSRTMLRTAGLDVVVVSMDPSNALIAWKGENEFHQELVGHSIRRCQYNRAKSKAALPCLKSGNGPRPDRISFGAEAQKIGSADQLALVVEGVADRRAGGEESLG